MQQSRVKFRENTPVTDVDASFPSMINKDGMMDDYI